MKKNMGNADKMIRSVIALVVILLYLAGVIEGTLAIVLITIAVIFAVTSAINFCPLYTLLGINTCKKKQD